MPAVSQAQGKLMGMVLALKRGELAHKDASPEVRKAARSMNDRQVKEFAATQRKGLPKRVARGGPRSKLRRARAM